MGPSLVQEYLIQIWSLRLNEWVIKIIVWASEFEKIGKVAFGGMLYISETSNTLWLFFLPNWNKCLQNYGILVFGM